MPRYCIPELRVKRFFPYYAYLRPALGHFIAAIICGAIYGVSSGLGVPFLLKTVLPVLFGDDKHRALVLVPNWHGWVDWPPLTISPEYVLAFAVALLPTVFAIRVSAEFANKYLLSFAGLRVLEGVRVAVFSRLQELHLDYFRRHKAGDLISRIMVDTNHVKTVIVDIANDFMIQPFTFVSAIGFIGYECFKYPGMERFLIALAAIPAVVVPVRIFGKKLLYKSEQMLSRTGGLSALLAESLQSPREIRAYNLEANERRRFSELVRGLFRSQMKMVKYEKMLSPLIEFLSAVSISIAVYQAAQLDISQGDAVALIGALYFAYEPVKKLSGIHNRIKSGLAGLTRLEEVLNAPVEVADPAVPVELGKVRGEVSLDAVTFAYGADSVLSDVSVKVHPGEVVALVGPSGAGKSTFVNLVLRFYDPQQGTVHVDGTDVRKVRQAELREAIALVSQEPILFNDTIYNNILLGRRDATREAVEQAAEQAGARDFIEAQPGGWDAVVGERGGQLSGGQRQRVAIARAFLKNSPILILDEATSALDAESEAVVQQALEKLVRGKTTFIIAHRFSTIRFATRILVFDKGRVVADGPHAALLESCPLYRTLYARQMAGT
jgi:subfamily B ATP-binding cassette protein MsbA